MGRRHGLVRALEEDCPCVDCQKQLVIARVSVDYLVNGGTLEECGRVFGVTRERIRQMVGMIDPEWLEKKKHHLRELKEEREAEERWRMWKERGTSCVVCGDPALKHRDEDRTSTCGPVCRKRWTVLRYLASAEEKERHRLAVSRWAVEHVDHPSVTPERLRLAEKELAGGDDIERHGRWTIPGSRVHEMAKQALREGWAIADQFPKGVCEALWEEMSGQMDDETGAA